MRRNPTRTGSRISKHVLKHSNYTPCNTLHNGSKVCLKKETVSNSFRKFLNETCNVKGNHHVAYKRITPAVSAEQVSKTALICSVLLTHELDHPWVVSYSPKLARSFAYHLNVKFCISQLGYNKYHIK